MFAVVDRRDADLGYFLWKAQANTDGVYAARTATGGKTVYLHAVVAGRLGLDLSGGKQVDHIDRDRLNCRRSNLRAATPVQNAGNCGARRRNPTGVRGVTTTPAGRYQARIRTNGVCRHLGCYDTIADAAAAYALAAVEYYGEFALPAAPLSLGGRE